MWRAEGAAAAAAAGGIDGVGATGRGGDSGEGGEGAGEEEGGGGPPVASGAAAGRKRPRAAAGGLWWPPLTGEEEEPVVCVCRGGEGGGVGGVGGGIGLCRHVAVERLPSHPDLPSYIAAAACRVAERPRAPRGRRAPPLPRALRPALHGDDATLRRRRWCWRRPCRRHHLRRRGGRQRWGGKRRGRKWRRRRGRRRRQRRRQRWRLCGHACGDRRPGPPVARLRQVAGPVLSPIRCSSHSTPLVVVLLPAPRRPLSQQPGLQFLDATLLSICMRRTYPL